MNFAHPEVLLAGVIACGLLLAVWRRHDARQRAALDSLVAPHLRPQLTASVSQARRAARRVLFATAVVLLFVALAGPQAGYRWEQTTRRGNDIMFAVDTSRSMLTPDVKPNRLTRAKMAIDDLVTHLDGDAVGLVAFAGTAFLQTPMTLDYGAFHDSLAALDTHIIPVGGTDISSAIRETQAALRGRPGSDKVLILITDGEDLQGDALTAARTAAKQDGLKIFTVGVGTANGDLIPMPQGQGGGFLRDSEGHLVKSHLDEAGLKALAAATGGSYAPLGATNEGLETIYRDALAPLAKHDLQARSQKVYNQCYQWPLVISLASLLCSIMVGTRRRERTAGPLDSASRLGKVAMPPALALLLAANFLPSGSAHASPASAMQAYDRGSFTVAEHEFSNIAQAHPRQALPQFDAGAAAYRAGDYSHAAEAFEASVNAEKSARAERLAAQEDAYYNLGNSLYREGQKTEQANTQDTIATWGRAIRAYDAALQLRTADADSKYNRDLVQRKLDALKKQQEQKQPQQQQNQSPQKPAGGQDAQGNRSSAKDHAQSSAQTSAQRQGSGKAGAAGASDRAGQTPPEPLPDSHEAPSAAAARPDGAQGPPTAAAAHAEPGADDQRAPGEMSRAEARELLDSVKDEQQHLPAAPVARDRAPNTSSNDTLKDW